LIFKIPTLQGDGIWNLRLDESSKGVVGSRREKERG